MSISTFQCIKWLTFVIYIAMVIFLLTLTGCGTTQLAGEGSQSPEAKAIVKDRDQLQQEIADWQVHYQHATNESEKQTIGREIDAKKNQLSNLNRDLQYIGAGEISHQTQSVLNNFGPAGQTASGILGAITLAVGAYAERKRRNEKKTAEALADLVIEDSDEAPRGTIYVNDLELEFPPHLKKQIANQVRKKAKQAKQSLSGIIEESQASLDQG